MNHQEERMGTENIWKLMFSMGIPTFIAQLINLLYNIVDRIYIGHIPGTGASALTGIGLCMPIITCVSAFSMFAGAGGAPRAAIELGKGNRKKAQNILSNSMTMLIAFAVIIMVVFYLWKKPFLYQFGASDATYPYANAYLSIYLAGSIFVMISLGMNMFITAQGQSKIAMCSVLIGAILNICLDPVFIFLLNMGIRGAAFATILSQAVSAVWVFRFLRSKKASLTLDFSLMKPNWKIIGSIAALGVSPFVMQVTESAITVIFNRGMQMYGNDLYVGSITIMQSVMQIIFVPMAGFTMGVQPIISYNYGQGNVDRVKTTCCRMIFMTAMVVFVLSGSAILMPKMFAGLFTTNSELITLCGKYMPIFLFGGLIFGIQNGCQQSFLALGEAKKSLFFALLRKVLLLIPLALILPAVTHSVMGIYVAEPVSDACSAICCGLTFLFSFKGMMQKAGK